MDPRVSLALRRRKGRPIQPEELAQVLHLSRRQVDKALAALQEAGFALESHPMLGVHLAGVPESLSQVEIACDLDALRIGRRVVCARATDSTNDLAWEAAGEGRDAADGLAVFAEQQSEGRGRRGARWLAPPHSSILCSVLVWWPAGGAEAALLTRTAAVAAADAVEELSDLDVGIKWPNDVVVDDRKVGGILVEVRGGGEAEAPAVVGIGLNCCQGAEAFPPSIRSGAASLAMLGAEVDRTLLARALLERLDRRFAEAVERPDDVRRAAAARCRTIGREVTIAEDAATYHGTVADLDADYGLIVRLADGSLRRFGAFTSHVGQPDIP